MLNSTSSVLVLGSGKLASSVPVCLAEAGHKLTLYTSDTASARKRIDAHLQDMGRYITSSTAFSRICISSELAVREPYGMALVVSEESLEGKKALIDQLENKFPANMPILVNTESIPLSAIQQGCKHPERIMGANWTEPAHTTLFLELIANKVTDKKQALELLQLAKDSWKKDPYLLEGDAGIRSRLMSAMLREAFFMVEKGYASVEDIDRACRNDAGYYLPFAGNFRYMDLMGTYAYGMVMKELNRELSQEKTVPELLTDKIQAGQLGMEQGKGFYDYPDDAATAWQQRAAEFAYRIRSLMDKYPGT